MKTPAKIGGFALGLAAVFAIAVTVGSAVGPVPVVAGAPQSTDHSGDEMSSDSMVAALPGGLMTAADGYRLQLAARPLPAGEQIPLDLTIFGPDGKPFTDYAVAHDKELHLIVVRRDMTQFQHVHPVRSAVGTWSVPVDLPAAGEYRVLADFTPSGHDGITLGADLSVAGSFVPQPLPAPSRTAEVDGYTVELEGTLTAGGSSELTLSVNRDGAPVTDLQPYLAAYGHLVALRDGDLAYLHVHPAGSPGDGATPSGPGITFFATAPSAGDYRLFLDFRHGEAVHTAEFTVHVEHSTATAPTQGETTHTDDGHGH
jgi:hypothetical protein